MYNGQVACPAHNQLLTITGMDENTAELQILFVVSSHASIIFSEIQ